jgi:hypothetical protein
MEARAQYVKMVSKRQLSPEARHPGNWQENEDSLLAKKAASHVLFKLLKSLEIEKFVQTIKSLDEKEDQIIPELVDNEGMTLLALSCQQNKF